MDLYLMDFLIWLMYGASVLAIYSGYRRMRINKKIRDTKPIVKIHPIAFKQRVNRADLLDRLACCIARMNVSMAKCIAIGLYLIISFGVNSLLWPWTMYRLMLEYDDLEDELRTFMWTNHVVKT